MNSLLTELRKKFGDFSIRKGTEYIFTCPKCGKKKLEINLRVGGYYCFRCGKGGNMREFIKTKHKFVPKTGTYTNGECIGKYIIIEGFEDVLTESACHYLLRRGISIERTKEIGMGMSSQYELRGRIIIPIKENNMIVCYVARSTDPNCKLKEISPPISVSNKSHYLYNIDDIEQGENVIVVEGIFDCEHLRRFGYKPVACMGSNLSDIQIGKLLTKKPKTIYMLFDGDKAGIEATRKNFERIMRRSPFQNIRRVICVSGKDPDELSKEEIEKALWFSY